MKSGIDAHTHFYRIEPPLLLSSILTNNARKTRRDDNDGGNWTMKVKYSVSRRREASSKGQTRTNKANEGLLKIKAEKLRSLFLLESFPLRSETECDFRH